MSATAYKVIKAADTDLNGLASQVTALMASSWQPTGPVVFAGGFIYQSLVQGTPIGSGGADYTLPAAATGAIGGVLLAPAQVDSVAVLLAALVTDFNALLAKLRTSGVLHT